MTMKSEVLALLKRRWITPLDALELAGCLSLSQRAGDLQREGVTILKRWVDLPSGKRVRAYRVG